MIERSATWRRCGAKKAIAYRCGEAGEALQAQDALIKITTFNLEARYPDETRSVRKKCTEDFARVEHEKINEVYSWLSRLIP